jgi:hypothetical protein
MEGAASIALRAILAYWSLTIESLGLRAGHQRTQTTSVLDVDRAIAKKVQKIGGGADAKSRSSAT